MARPGENVPSITPPEGPSGVMHVSDFSCAVMNLRFASKQNESENASFLLKSTFSAADTTPTAHGTGTR